MLSKYHITQVCLIMAFVAAGLLSLGRSPLRSVSVSVKTHLSLETSERVLDVQFSKLDDCFVTPPGTKVFLNGAELAMISPGRKLSNTSRIKGIDIPARNCEAALFRSRPFTAAREQVDRIEVQMSGRSSTIEIESLLAERSLQLSTTSFEPGAQVTAEWLPRSDVWPRNIVGAEIHLDAADIGSVVISGPALQSRKGKFQFVVPQVRFGSATLVLYPGTKAPVAPVKKCPDFAGCQVEGIIGAAPVAITIRAASGARGH